MRLPVTSTSSRGSTDAPSTLTASDWLSNGDPWAAATAKTRRVGPDSPRSRWLVTLRFTGRFSHGPRPRSRAVCAAASDHEGGERGQDLLAAGGVLRHFRQLRVEPLLPQPLVSRVEGG